jgi:hypothetical protein
VGSPNAPARAARVVEADLKHALGYLGAALLFVGLFLPLVDVPSLGSLNYFWNTGAGALLLILVAGSFVALATRRFWALWLSGATAGASVVVTLVRAILGAEPMSTLARAQRPAPSSLQGALASGLDRGISEAAQLQWGWPVLVLGSLLLLAAAEVARREGLRAPGFFRDLVLATALLIAMLVIGPPVLSHTQKAFVDFKADEKQQERLRWEPHESAREKMAAVMAQTREEEEIERLALDEAERLRAERERRRAHDPHAVRIRLVADVRRWYPRFAPSLRPVVEARDALVRRYRDGGFAAAAGTCRTLVEALRGAAEAYPRSPDRDLHDAMTRLIALGDELDPLCPEQPTQGAGGGELESSAQTLEAVLDQLAVELAGYCLDLPGGGDGLPTSTPSSWAAREPRPFDGPWMLALR